MIRDDNTQSHDHAHHTPYMVLEFRLGVQAGTAHPLLRRESFDQTAALAVQRPLEA